MKSVCKSFVWLGGLGLFMAMLASCLDMRATNRYRIWKNSNVSEIFSLFDRLECDEAIKQCHTLLENKAQIEASQFILAQLYLAKGEFRSAWPYWLQRWNLPRWNFDWANVAWKLGDDIQGKIIFVRDDCPGFGGLGDVFQLIRFAKTLKERGASKVFFEIKTKLFPILQNCKYIDAFFSTENGDKPIFDLQASTWDIPALLNISLDEVPCDVPYIFVCEPYLSKWHNILKKDSNFKVGLCWQSSGDGGCPAVAVRRDILFESFNWVSNVEGISVYCLLQPMKAKLLAKTSRSQKKIDNQIYKIANVHVIDDLDRDGAFLDTAAIMKNLDLVITVDTSLTHLAGALGVRTWVLLPFNAEYRWLQFRNDSPWYPSMTLFRQTKAGNWADVFKRVCDALIQTLAKHRAEKE